MEYFSILKHGMKKTWTPIPYVDLMRVNPAMMQNSHLSFQQNEQGQLRVYFLFELNPPDDYYRERDNKILAMSDEENEQLLDFAALTFAWWQTEAERIRVLLREHNQIA